MDISTTVRAFMLAATIAATGMATTSCGEEVKPPSQEIGVQLPEPEVKHFEPACNTRAAVTPCPEPDTWSGNGIHNRKQFDDEYARR